MRPTTKRRVVILVLVILLSSLALGGVYAFRQYQINSRLMAARAEGLAAFKDGDYAAALEPLSKYNTKFQNDAETLFAFGKARSRVEAPGNRHLAEAIQYFRRGLEIQPDNLDARHQLLELYSTTGYSAEALAMADDLLKKNPGDVAAVRAKGLALEQLRRFDDALAASRKLNELAPLDVEGWVMTVRQMALLNKPVVEILTLAQKVRDAHPDDPRFVMLKGLAFQCAVVDNRLTPGGKDTLIQSFTTPAEREDITKPLPAGRGLTLQDVMQYYYRQAAAMPAPDEKFVQVCTRLMDGVGMFDKSQELLERAAASSGNDPKMVRMLVQRLWQNGKYDQVVNRLKDLDASTTASDSHLLAYRAYSLYQLQKNADAKPIVDALAARKDDDVALAWAKALTTRFETPDANPRERISQYQAALVRDPGNAVVRYLMGEGYAQLGETELALQSWRQVVAEVPSWPTPRTQIAYLLAATGRSQLAVDEARKGYERGQNLGSAIGLAVALASHFERSNQPQAAGEVLKIVSEIQTKVPGEPQTLPMYVNLLARSGKKDQAVQELRTAIDKAYPVGADTWLRLAAVSRANNLGLEQPILAHAEKAYGFSPRLALANAVIRADAKDPQGGLQYLTDAAAKAKDDQATWKLAVAQYREQLRDAKSRDAWVELGDQFPENLEVQGAILDLADDSSAWQDRPFIERTIQRVRTLTGDQGFRWQFARCRWLLTNQGRNKEKDLAEAIVGLSSIIRSSPGLVLPRIYLAKAMEESNNFPAAIEQLQTAARMDPDNSSTTLGLVRLFHKDGKFADARPYLDRVAKTATDSLTRQHVAYFYREQNDLDSAINVLSPTASTANQAAPRTPNEPTADALLADLLRRRGDLEQAGQIYQDLVARPDADPLILSTAADFFATHGKMDQAKEAMNRLSQLELRPGLREVLLASFQEKHGGKDAAADLLQQAVRAAPADADIWRQLIGFHLRQDQFDRAIAACDEATKALPENEDIKSLRVQAASLRGADGKVDNDALAAEFSKDPRNAAVSESLAALKESRRLNEKPVQAAARFRPIADRHPRFLPVQMQLVRTYMEARQPDEAAAIAVRTMEAFPADPEPARMATAVYGAAGRWSDALTAAQAWRKRTLDRPIEADLAIARALMQLRQPADAIKQLEPYVDAARREPDKNSQILGTYAQALILDNRVNDAAALMEPHLTRSSEWRMAWLRMTPMIPGRDPAPTVKWTERGAAGVPADSLREQYEVANAWYVAGVKFKQNEYFAKAQEVLTPLAQRPDATAAVMTLAGALADKRNDRDAAIAAYRRALQLDPNLPIVQNNLAYLLLTKGTDLDEARQLAEKAVTATDDVNYHDTLARVYAKAGSRDRAIASFHEVLKRDPNNVQAMAPAVRLLREQGQQEAANAMLRKLDSLLQANPALKETISEDLQSLRQSSIAN